MKLRVIVPENMKDITLDRYVRYSKMDLGNVEQEFIDRKMLNIFYDILGNDFDSIPLADVRYLVSKVELALTEKPEFVNRFTHNDIEYGFIPNLDKMTYGEFVDLQSVEGDLISMMAILYRPIIKKSGNSYKIEPYNGFKQRIEVMKQIPLSIAVGCLGFFLTLFKDLLSSTLNSLEKTVLIPTKNAYSVKNGDGILRLLHLQMDSVDLLMKQHPLMFMKH